MDNYFKFDKTGNLIWVNETEGWYQYITPPYNDRREWKKQTPGELMFYIEEQLENAPKTYYPREDEGLVIKL